LGHDVPEMEARHGVLPQVASHLVSDVRCRSAWWTLWKAHRIEYRC